MSRYTNAAVTHGGAGTNAIDEEDEYEYNAATGGHVERDFLRRNLSQFYTIYSSLSSTFYRTSSHNRRNLLQPHYNSAVNMEFPPSNRLNPANGICSHFLRRGFTKPVKFLLNTAVWSADGRWLVLGTQSGDFALWEGEQLKVHKVVSVPAHKVLGDGGRVQDYIPITAMAWNHHGNTLISGDNNGLIHYSDESFRSNLSVADAHTGPIRGLSFSPFDSKLVSCSDDSLLKLWTVGGIIPEVTLSGHQSDVRCVDWHPYRSLIASGSRESVIKLWDPKQGVCVSNISSHKKSVICCKWNENGNWLATGAKDGLVKIFDIRVMKEMESLRGHNSDLCSLAWHPQYESLLLSGGYNGSLIYWLVNYNQSAHTAIGDAHRQSIDVIAWHPGGHLVATASHDCILKFWCREPPGSKIDAKLAPEFTEAQPPMYGYGPLPSGGTTPKVILQSSVSQHGNTSTVAGTSNEGNMTMSTTTNAKIMNTGSHYGQNSGGGGGRFNRTSGNVGGRGGGFGRGGGGGGGGDNRKRPRDQY